jgi:hypothetical protein
MGRLIALNALFFLLPFAGYGAWLLATRGSLGTARDWPARVVVYLCIGGALIMGVGLVTLTSFSGASPDDDYRPAVLRDGKIVPGGFEPER